ncbi:CAP-Gly domain-containing linker protein 4 isoform X3 [Gouania willdenowi]|uniref:CAP-Gly domain-containing linker protein 4 isoform X3 n=1 Tax=Gouania willdenowi TaxID=441366 RepID=UPI0010558D0C|nr:CAP-Gly domain-containing linker protein 4-like isoform X3 [Gouania willdenowi]
MTREDVSEPVEEDVVLGDGSRFSSQQRPVIYQVASAPTPSDCEFSFFDPCEPRCRQILLDPSTTIPELFAVLRQWVPQVQKNIDLIGNQILKRGCGVNDRDGLTDMSLLHYCCKAGAPGIGDADTAASFARQLLRLGADPNLRSRWTNMRALHYATYFDVPELIRVVLQASQPEDCDATCSDFDFGTALHIAASNLCTSAARCLLELGANPAFRNKKGLCPADVVPNPLDMPLEMADAVTMAKELRAMLIEALPRPSSPLPPTLPSLQPLSDEARIQLASMGIRLGDKVVIAGQKVGTLRFCGSTEFSGGLWAGVELDKPEGKNDGSVVGVRYFTCQIRHGIFAPLSKISKLSQRHKTRAAKTTPTRPPRRMDQSCVSSKISTARPRPLPKQRPTHRQRRERASMSPRTTPLPDVHTSPVNTAGPLSRTPTGSSSLRTGSEVCLGDRVLVVKQRTGVVQFYGKTNFAPGLWLGIELDKPSGKNDGSVGGVRYFSCPPKHGLFAPPSHVQRIHGSVGCLSELTSARLRHSLNGTIRRSFSTSSAIATPKEASRKSSVTSRSRSNPQRRRRSTLSGGSGSLPVNTARSSPSPGPDGPVRLHVGMQVLLSSANEMAVIRYLGTADFAPGLWLGLELRSPRGRNDGSVGGRRYFSCRPGHGVLVRPSRVTYRGISGSCLVNEKS